MPTSYSLDLRTRIAHDFNDNGNAEQAEKGQGPHEEHRYGGGAAGSVPGGALERRFVEKSDVRVQTSEKDEKPDILHYA